MSPRAPTRYRAALRAFKARYWAKELARCGSITGAARENGVNRTYLCELVRLLGIPAPRKTNQGKWDRPIMLNAMAGIPDRVTE